MILARRHATSRWRYNVASEAPTAFAASTIILPSASRARAAPSLVSGDDLRVPAKAADGAGDVEAGFHALDDQVVLDVGDGREQVAEQATGGVTGIEPVGDRHERDAPVADAADRVPQVLNGAAEAVESGNDARRRRPRAPRRGAVLARQPRDHTPRRGWTANPNPWKRPPPVAPTMHPSASTCRSGASHG
jgi:hypothetical protein